MADPKLIAKIKALLSKTMASGATEAEAFSAAMKARQLMDREGIELTDLEAAEMSRFVCDRHGPTGHAKFDVRMTLLTAICQFTDTRGFIVDHERSVALFGTVPDIIFAEWLLETLEGFCNRRALGYLFNRPLKKKGKRGEIDADDMRAIREFADSCAFGIAERMFEIARQRRKADPETYDRKNAAAFEAAKRAGLRPSGREKYVAVKSPSTTEGMAGYRAAADAHFNQPVNGKAQAPLLLS